MEREIEIFFFFLLILFDKLAYRWTVLTGTPKLYASTLTMRIHQDRYITYEFLAVVYGRLPVSINYLHIWIFSHGSYIFSSANLFTVIWTPTRHQPLSPSPSLSHFMYVHLQETDVHMHAHTCTYTYTHIHIYIRTHTHNVNTNNNNVSDNNNNNNDNSILLLLVIIVIIITITTLIIIVILI